MFQTRQITYFNNQKCQVINAENKEKPEAIVVFLHGRGDTATAFINHWIGYSRQKIRKRKNTEGYDSDDGSEDDDGDLNTLAVEDNSLINSKIKYIFPEAPLLFGSGYEWFESNNDLFNENEESLFQASDKLISLIDDQLEQYPYLTNENIILGGLSQGGALASFTAMRRILEENQKSEGNGNENAECANLPPLPPINSTNKEPYALLIGLATWLPGRRYFSELNNENKNTNTKVFLGHGKLDQIVPLNQGQTLANVISEYVEFAGIKIYDGLYHWMRQDMMDDVRDFIEERVL